MAACLPRWPKEKRTLRETTLKPSAKIFPALALQHDSQYYSSSLKDDYNSVYEGGGARSEIPRARAGTRVFSGLTLQ